MKRLLSISRHRRRWLPMQGLLGVCTLVLVLTACGGQSANQQQPTPTNVALPPLPTIGALPPGAANAVAMGLVSPNTMLSLTIGLATNRQALANDLEALYDPSSPEYGQFLTPDQVAARYGAAQSDVDKVTAFLTSQGFQVQDVSSLRDSITVSATVAQIAQAFHLILQTYQLNGKTFIGPSGQFNLPADIQPLITSVIGLSNFAQPFPAYYHGAPLAVSAASGPAGAQVSCPQFQGSGTTTPNQLAVTYNYSGAYKAGYTGKGITIAEIEFNDGVSTQDLQNFLACTTHGKLHYKVIRVNGGTLVVNSDDTGEADLDLEQISSLAPDAQILEYQENFCQDATCSNGSTQSFSEALVNAMNRIARDGKAQVASVSWGGDEQYYAQDEVHAIDQAAQRLAAEGITFTVATGDCAAYESRVYGQLAVQIPSSDPYVVGVGGTTLQTDNAGHRTSEIAWSDASAPQNDCMNSWGSGGGVSVVFKQPSYQKGTSVKNQYSTGKREVPDVAAVANAVPELQDGQWFGSGGTSAAAPIWAAGIALVDQGLKQHHKHPVGGPATFYQVANKPGRYHPYFDVTQGDNLYYKCSSGWDYPTGWGVPNIVDFGKVLGGF